VAQGACNQLATRMHPYRSVRTYFLPKFGRKSRLATVRLRSSYSPGRYALRLLRPRYIVCSEWGALYRGEPAAAAVDAREDAGAHVHRALVGDALGNGAGTSTFRVGYCKPEGQRGGTALRNGVVVRNSCVAAYPSCWVGLHQWRDQSKIQV